MGFLIAYGIVAVALGMFGGIGYMMSRGEDADDERIAARVALSAPVWPLLLPYFLYVSIKMLWKSAGLSKPKPNSGRKETDY